MIIAIFGDNNPASSLTGPATEMELEPQKMRQEYTEKIQVLLQNGFHHICVLTNDRRHFQTQKLYQSLGSAKRSLVIEIDFNLEPSRIFEEPLILLKQFLS